MVEYGGCPGAGYRRREGIVDLILIPATKLDLVRQIVTAMRRGTMLYLIFVERQKCVSPTDRSSTTWYLVQHSHTHFTMTIVQQ